MKTASDVSIRNLFKTYGSTVAVDGISLEVPPGAFVTILGPSGCGKTTTLRMIAGFEQPDSGDVFIQGKPIGNTPPYARPTAMVFQGYALFPHMSVSENIAFGLRERNVARGEIRERVRAMLELIGLPGLGDRLPKQLSGGQQQRVALARSLVVEPAVLLLDEPLGALDVQLRQQMQMLLKRIQRQVGITFIYVTHDQEEAFTMSDRIVVMANGRLEQEGSAEEIYHCPASRFVAEFMGAGNVLPVQVEPRDATSSVVVLAGRRMIVPQPRPNGDIVLVIRPERIRLGSPDGWQGRVVERLFKGAVTSYRIELVDGTVMVADVAHDGAGHRYVVGEDVTQDFRASDARLISGTAQADGIMADDRQPAR